MQRLPLGGTAVGTGINAHPDFGPLVAGRCATSTGCPFKSAKQLFRGYFIPGCARWSCPDSSKPIACSLMKIANDLRLMNSGPLAGIGDIELPALQPGSSIMPGKVNPVIPEADLHGVRPGDRQ